MAGGSRVALSRRAEDAPAEVRWTVLRIGSDPEHGFGGLNFSEV
jgi:hypothetical protein